MKMGTNLCTDEKTCQIVKENKKIIYNLILLAKLNAGFYENIEPHHVGRGGASKSLTDQCSDQIMVAML